MRHCRLLLSRLFTCWQRLTGLPSLPDGMATRCCLHLRFVLPAALLLLAAAALLIPAPAGACGMNDAEGCVFTFQYGVYENVARVLWGINRMLLVAAYQLDAVRYWMVQYVFSGAYNAVVSLVDPIVAVTALLALTILSLLLMLAPLFGMRPQMSFKLVFAILLFGPIVITMVGQGFGELERTRVELAASFASAGQQVVSAISFGTSGSDLPPTVPFLYPSSHCPSHLERMSGGAITHAQGYPASTMVVRIDEQAAAFLFADVQDIHCPAQIGGSGVPGLPASYDDPLPGATNGYAANDVSLVPRTERQLRLEAIIAGITRLVYGLVLSGLAVLNAGLHLVFTACLILVFLTLPISMLLGMFQGTLSWLSILIRRTVAIMQASWMTSLIIGIISAGLSGAFATGNAISVVGFASGGFLMTAYAMVGALGMFKQSLGGVNEIVGAASGLGSGAADIIGIGKTALGGAAAATVGIGAAAATGGATLAAGAAIGSAQTALTGLQAHRASGGNSSYTLGAMLGRSRRLRVAGEQLHAAGMLGEGVIHGMQAGRTARKAGTYRAQQLMDRDAKTGAALRSEGEQAAGIIAQEAQRAARAARRGSGSNAVAVLDAAANAVGSVDAAAGTGAATGPATAVRANPDTRSPRKVVKAPAKDNAELRATGARVRLNASNADIGTLIRAGYTVQRQPDGHSAYWREDGATEAAAPADARFGERWQEYGEEHHPVTNDCDSDVARAPAVQRGTNLSPARRSRLKAQTRTATTGARRRLRRQDCSYAIGTHGVSTMRKEDETDQ